MQSQLSHKTRKKYFSLIMSRPVHITPGGQFHDMHFGLTTGCIYVLLQSILENTTSESFLWKVHLSFFSRKAQE